MATISPLETLELINKSFKIVQQLRDAPKQIRRAHNRIGRKYAMMNRIVSQGLISKTSPEYLQMGSLLKDFMEDYKEADKLVNKWNKYETVTDVRQWFVGATKRVLDVLKGKPKMLQDLASSIDSLCHDLHMMLSIYIGPAPPQQFHNHYTYIIKPAMLVTQCLAGNGHVVPATLPPPRLTPAPSTLPWSNTSGGGGASSMPLPLLSSYAAVSQPAPYQGPPASKTPTWTGQQQQQKGPLNISATASTTSNYILPPTSAVQPSAQQWNSLAKVLSTPLTTSNPILAGSAQLSHPVVQQRNTLPSAATAPLSNLDHMPTCSSQPMAHPIAPPVYQRSSNFPTAPTAPQASFPQPMAQPVGQPMAHPIVQPMPSPSYQQSNSFPNIPSLPQANLTHHPGNLTWRPAPASTQSFARPPPRPAGQPAGQSVSQQQNNNIPNVQPASSTNLAHGPTRFAGPLPPPVQQLAPPPRLLAPQPSHQSAQSAAKQGAHAHPGPATGFSTLAYRPAQLATQLNSLANHGNGPSNRSGAVPLPATQSAPQQNTMASMPGWSTGAAPSLPRPAQPAFAPPMPPHPSGGPAQPQRFAHGAPLSASHQHTHPQNSPMQYQANNMGGRSQAQPIRPHSGPWMANHHHHQQSMEPSRQNMSHLPAPGPYPGANRAVVHGNIGFPNMATGTGKAPLAQQMGQGIPPGCPPQQLASGSCGQAQQNHDTKKTTTLSGLLVL